MKNVHSRILSLLMALILLIGLCPVGAHAAEQLETIQETHINPLYADTVTEEDLKDSDDSNEPPLLYSQSEYRTTLEAVGADMREAMEYRSESITVYYQTTNLTYPSESFSDDVKAIMRDIFDAAVVHTGEPTEGDYLRWHYAGWKCSVKPELKGNMFLLTFTYTMTYYTTYEMEEMVTEKVDEVLESLDLDGKSDYNKILAVYDYICDNIEYDYDNLYNDSYKLKHSAYAALINKTAVCQGYALLLYRFALEMDIDCRLIAGTGNGGGHGWNIVKLGDLYYNLDSTWDAGVTNYRWFLKSPTTFTDHIRYEEYNTAQFHVAYPMSSVDFQLPQGSCGQNVTWILDENGTLTISGAGAMTDFANASDAPWYSERAQIKKIVIESGVTSIGDRAFYNCTELTEVTIGTGVKTVGTYAFRGCSALKNVTIPSNVTELKDSAFRLCSALELVLFEGNAPGIGTYTFGDCASGLEIHYYEDGTGFNTGLWLLLNRKAQHKGQWVVDRPASCTAAGNRYIDCSYCNRRINETIPVLDHEYVDGICKNCPAVQILGSGDCGYRLTWELDGLGNLRITGTGDMTNFMYSSYVPWAAYRDVIKNVEIDSRVTSIGRYAFYFCNNLTSINIPDSVTSIGKEAFSCCGNLPSITIPDSVVSIGKEAFIYCNSLKQISLPDSVTSLGEGAFYGCSGLANVRLSSGLTSIAAELFYGCENLISIDIPNNVKTIGDYAFSNCGKIETMILPASVEVVGENAFYHCYSLEEIYFANSKASWDTMGVAYKGYVHYSCTEPEGHWTAETIGATCSEEGYVLETCACAHQRTTTIPGFADHKDETPKDHICDTCPQRLSPCADGNNDHKCDLCSGEVSKCTDADKDGMCDVCEAEVKIEEPKPEDPNEPGDEPTDEPIETPAVEGATRLAGANRLVTSYLVADMLKDQMGVEKFDAVIVASGSTFADALPGSYLSAAKNAPILLTLAKDKFIQQTADYIKENLAEGGTVYILGGESAVPASMEKALADFNVQRVAGSDRFGTNLEILKTSGVAEGDEILVCEAKGYADSLSASATGKPILLVYKKLTAAQKEYLSTLTSCNFTVVGGTSAVPEALAKEIEAYGTVTRLAGKDRLETSTMVAEKYFAGASTAVVAYGWDFPDGLCGGSLAYAMKAPLILTHSKAKLYGFTAEYTTNAGITDGYVLGGDGLVSDEATRAIFGMEFDDITVLE